jgi:UDP-N-acetyl-2-amino-2-deoxyglucuronate dehydrogenase
VHISDKNRAAGYLELERARIRWFLSLDINDIPRELKEKGQRTYRLITLDNNEIEFSEGFTELHTMTYREILSGGGFGLEDARRSIETVYAIRNSKPEGLSGEYHPLLKTILK